MLGETPKPLSTVPLMEKEEVKSAAKSVAAHDNQLRSNMVEINIRKRERSDDAEDELMALR